MNHTRSFLSNKVVSLLLILTTAFLGTLASYAQENRSSRPTEGPRRISDQKGALRTPVRQGGTQNSPKKFPGKKAKLNPRNEKASSLQFKERHSENPPRFVFAPQNKPTQGAPWDQNPSATAIWSTFLTGNISPELTEWHVNQRKKVQYEKALTARGERPMNGSSEAKTSEYARMINRMEFSFASHNGMNYEEGGVDPSGGAILLQLMTGYKNGEMKGWKENQIALAQNQQNDESVESETTEWGYPQQIATATMSLQRNYPAPNPIPPLSSPPQRESESQIRGPVMIANAEENRFVDDHFPSIRQVGYLSDSDNASSVKSVSSTVEKPAPISSASLLTKGETVDRPGQIKVYSSEEHSGKNVIRRLPENGARLATPDNEGWSPVE